MAEGSESMMTSQKTLEHLQVEDRGSDPFVLHAVSFGFKLASAGIIDLPVDNNRFKAEAMNSDGSHGTGFGSTRKEAIERAVAKSLK